MNESLTLHGNRFLRVLAVDDEPPALDELAYLLRADPRVAAVSTAADVADALAAGKRVAAIGTAPVILAEGGFLKGKKATCYPWDFGGRPRRAYVKRLQATGAIWLDKEFVESGRILTGRAPHDIRQFALALRARLTKPRQR